MNLNVNKILYEFNILTYHASHKLYFQKMVQCKRAMQNDLGSSKVFSKGLLKSSHPLKAGTSFEKAAVWGNVCYLIPVLCLLSILVSFIVSINKGFGPDHQEVIIQTFFSLPFLLNTVIYIPLTILFMHELIQQHAYTSVCIFPLASYPSSPSLAQFYRQHFQF